jgi:hypothetical protein
MGRFGVLRQLLFSLLAVASVPSACGGRSEEPPPIDSPPIDVRIASACVRLLSCPSNVTHRSVSECILANAGPFMSADPQRVVTGINTFSDTRSASLECINGAGASCGAISACATGTTGDCTGLPADGAICEGNRYVFCRDGARNEIDCTTKDCELSFACDVQPKAAACLLIDGKAECGFEPCTKETFVEVCDGNDHVVCQNGVVKHIDCAPGAGRAPTTCGERKGGGIGCISLAPACSPESRPHCVGSDVVSCIQGLESRRACGTYPIPMTCDVDEECGPDGTCVACIPSPRLRCDPRHHADRCNGARVVYCDGQEREIDCTALGFLECSSTSSGAACR